MIRDMRQSAGARRTFTMRCNRFTIGLGIFGVTFLILTGISSGGGEGDDAPKIALKFHREPDKRVKVATMRFGISLPGVKNPNRPKQNKKLTYDAQGITSTVCLKVDGEEILFGSPPGQWKEMETKLTKKVDGMRSVWQLPRQKVAVTQTVYVGKGKQTFAVDTCHIFYTIHNQDEEPHRVGLRFLLDTFIGTNDGAPFIIPGEKELLETMKEFSGDKVPAFAQALESFDFSKPGVIAHLNFKMGVSARFKGNKNPVPVESPNRVAFTSWPDPLLKLPGTDGFLTKWQVPLISIQKSKDAAAVFYWDEKEIPAGDKRVVGFTYGLGNFSANAAGNLGVILAGSFLENRDFTVLALVKNAKAGQTLKLHLTDGLARSDGAETQTVAVAKGETKISPVTWMVRSLRAGTFVIGIESSTGDFHHQGVKINKKTQNGKGS